MKAVGLTRYLPISNPESLLDLDVPRPEPASRDLLVRVEAVSVNPVDTKVRRSKGPDAIEPVPRILGWDAAGVVEAVGSDVSLFEPGDGVFYAGSITRAGCNSEYHLVDERIAGRKPDCLSFPEAAALPLTAITAWEAFFDRMHIDRHGGHSGKTLLIIAGAGGVGSIGIQLAKLAGLAVIATASRPETVGWCKAMGADHVVNHREPLLPQIRDRGFGDVHFIANFADTDAYWTAMADLVRPEGRICCIVENRAPVDIGLLKSKSAAFHWEFMFTRAMFETEDMITQHLLLDDVARFVEQGKLRSTLTSTLAPINAINLRRAHEQIESGCTIGKIALTGWK